MTYSFFKSIVIAIVFIVISNSVYCSSLEQTKADSINIYRLFDSVNSNFEEPNKALKFSKEAYNLALKSANNHFIAQSEFVIGNVLYFNDEYDSALNYLHLSLSKFTEIHNNQKILSLLEYISSTYNEINQINESIKYANIGMKFADSIGNNNYKANFYLLLGTSYQEIGLYEKSTSNLIKALSLFEENEDTDGVSSTLVNLGLVFAHNKYYDKALEVTQRALDIYKNNNDQIGISACLNNIGYFYSFMNQNDNALTHFKLSLEIDKKIGDEEGVATCYNNIGDSYLALQDTALAIKYYSKCYKLAIDNNYSVNSVVLYNFGDIYLSQSKLKLALSYALKSLEAAQIQNNKDEILSSYNLLQKCYAALHDYKNAYANLKIYKSLYDSSFSVAKSKNIDEIISLYNDKKQKTEIVSLKKQTTDDSIFIEHLLISIVAILFMLAAMFIAMNYVRKAKNKHKSQKLYYEKILERSEDFIFIIGTDGLTKYISPSYQRKIGREIDNRIGTDSFEYIHPDDVDFVKRDFAKLMTDGKPRVLEFRIENAAGEWINVSSYGQNLLNDKTINGIVVNFWDITQRIKDEQHIKDSEVKFRQIFNSFPDIYIECDLHGIITEISPSVEKITGYSPNEVIGVKADKYISHANEWELFKEKFKSNNFISDFDITFKKKDGKNLNLSLSAEIILSENNEPIAVKGVIHDITQRMQDLANIKKSEQELKKANSAKKMLFSIIAHDLIGPIGVNKSILDLIVSNVDEFSHEELVTLVVSLKPTMDSTFSLIENLLSWARIQQNQLVPNFETISLNNIVNNIVAVLDGQASQKSIRLKVIGDKLEVIADKNQLDVSLRNIVANAIKFSNVNSDVVIEISRKDNMAVTTITDTGVGMNQTQIDDILIRGGSTQVKRGTSNEKGTGFGLVIVNEFIKNNKGTLGLYSQEGTGTTFIVKIPLAG